MKKLSAFFGLLLLSLVALTGCATDYQKEGVFTNGYSDYRTSDNTFVVTFRANEHTPPEKVLQYSLQRAATLTLKYGFRYFTILEEKTHLHHPSLRLTVQCTDIPTDDQEWLEATSFK